MNSNTRRVAVVGGNRVPFARCNSVYAHASTQDMLTAALDELTAACPTPSPPTSASASGQTPQLNGHMTPLEPKAKTGRKSQ